MTEKKINGKTIRLIKGDLTDLDVDAFTFYATEDLALGSGYGTAITIRGGPKIQEELQTLAPVSMGDAVVSAAGELKADYIIHAVGPKFQEEDEEGKLRKAMTSSLKKAEEKGIKRLAFPPMGSGFYGIPVDLCARVMLETIKEHLSGSTPLDEIIICTPDTREMNPFASKLETL